MSAPGSYDAIVIGGGANGLIAAAHLAKAQKKVLLLEAQDRLGGLCGAANLGEGFSSAQASTFYALDPLVLRDLKLSRRGLRFAGHELALTGLRSDGKHIVISRNVHDTAASIAVHSRRDAEAWPRFRKELFGLARAMRPLWWEADGAYPSGAAGQEIERIARMGAVAWLDSWFESDGLKATLCFDATAAGLSTLEPGSALSLIWRAAQEMSGLQGAVLPGSSALVDVLTAVARDGGCELRTGAPVNRLILDENRVAGVQLRSGEMCFARLVFSAVSGIQTISELAPAGAFGLAHANSLRPTPMGEALVRLTIRNAPLTGGTPASRFVIAEKLESYASAEIMALNGQMGDELPLEFLIPTFSDASTAPPGQHILSARIRPVPRSPSVGWASLRSKLTAQVVMTLERLMPKLARDISHVELLPPDNIVAGICPTVRRMLMKTVDRIETPVEGLFLCGADAEPIPAISGRAARIATNMAVKT